MTLRSSLLALLVLGACTPAQTPVVEQPPANDADASAPVATVASDASVAPVDASSNVVAADDGGGTAMAPVATVDAGARADAGPATCPPAYGGFVACSPATALLRCAYPQGVCQCASPPMCGGAYRPPLPARWTCEPPKAPCASAGSPCKKAGDVCYDGPCPYGRVMSCEKGVWVARMVSPPP